MAFGIPGIDHAVIVAHDLEAARSAYARLGFTLTPRGRHLNRGTANYCIMFGPNYLELLGVVAPEEGTADRDRLLAERGEGLHELALAMNDSKTTLDALRGAGIAADGPRDLRRQLELPEGAVTPAFSLGYLPEAALAPPGHVRPLKLFLCQHLTPELVRRPQWVAHPNGALRLASVTVVVDDPPALQEGYERLFGTGSTVTTDETLTVFTRLSPRESIVFIRPADIETLHPNLPETFERKTPFTAAMRLAVHNPAAAAACLKANSIAYDRMIDGTIVVGPDDAAGVGIEFVASDVFES